MADNPSLIALSSLGIPIGMAFLPVVNTVYWRVARHATGNLAADNKSQAIVLLAVVAACIASGFVLLGPLWLLGFIPLGPSTQVFFLFWTIGVVAYRFYTEYRDSERRAQREEYLNRSIDLEIEERRHEK